MNTRRIKLIASKLLLGCAYILLVLQWLWLTLFALPALIDSGFFESLSQPNSTQAPIVQAPAIELSPIVLWAVVAITIALMATTFFVLLKLPKVIFTTGERVVEQTVHAVMPVVIHHKLIPAEKRRILSERLRLLVQVTASSVAGVICLFLPPVESMTSQVILVIGLGLMTLSIAGFVSAWLVRPSNPTSQTRLPASRG